MHAGQHVDGDRQDLEAEEQDDEVVGRRHDHAARRRQQQEDVGLGPVEALPAQVAVGEQGGDDHADAQITTMRNSEKPSTPTAPATTLERAVLAARGRHSGITGDDRAERHGDGDDGVPADLRLRRGSSAAEHQQQRPRRRSGSRNGEQRRPVDRGRLDGSSAASAWARRHGISRPPPRRRRRPRRPRPSRTRLLGVLARPRPTAGCSRQSECSSTWATSAVDRRLDPLEHRLRVDAEEHDQADAAGPSPGPRAGVRSAKLALSLVGLAVEHPLVGPQQVEGGEDHAGGGDHRPPAGGEERRRAGSGTRRRSR